MFYHRKNKTCYPLITLTVFFITVISIVDVCAEVIRSVGIFSQGDLSGWEEKSFDGNSHYRIVDSELGKILRASTEGKASGIFKKDTIDLTKTPWINWSWRVENTFKDNNERSKEGDDYAARIYVVVSGGIFFWNTKAVNYVWASHEPENSSWNNAYTDAAKMIAVRSGDLQTNKWISEKRNVREDFKNLFSDDVEEVDVIAVMVDGDNTGQSATSYFGDIFFTKN